MVASLHDPYAGTTPSQRLAWAARGLRLAKMAAGAKPDIAAPLPEPEPSPPIVRAPWFFIHSEIPTPLRIADIQAAVVKHFGITMTDLLSPRRTHKVIRPRQIAMYLAKTMTLRTLPEIGRRFGGRDHTTILHAVRKIEGLLPLNADLALDVEVIRAGIAA